MSTDSGPTIVLTTGYNEKQTHVCTELKNRWGQQTPKTSYSYKLYGRKKKCDDRTSRCQESHMKNKIKSFAPGEKKSSERSYNSRLYVEDKLLRVRNMNLRRKDR